MATTRIVFLAIVAISAMVSADAAKLGFRNEKNVNEGLGKLVEQYKQMVEESLGIYEDILKETIGDVTGNIREEAVKALQQLSKTAEEALSHLQHLRGRGKSVMECVAKNLPEVIALVQKTQETQTACLEGSLEKIEAIRNKLAAELAEVRQDVANVIANIQNCRDMDCMKENGAKLIELVSVVRGSVRNAVIAAVGVIQEISPAAIECLVAASDNFVAEIKPIHDKVVACVKA